MNKQLANNLFLAATLLASICTLCFGIYEYRREHAFRCDILHAQLQLNNHRYLNDAPDKAIRVTVIDTAGHVLYDSQARDIRQMANHLRRKEVQEALSRGVGFDIKRESETEGEKYFYSATFFPDSGFVVRSSVPYSAPLTQSLESDYTFFYYTAGILLLIALLLYMRRRLRQSEAEKQRIKRQLTENAAHELKTPAATIEGYLETLVENPDLPEEKRRRFLESCHAQSRRMSRLLSDMAMLSRLDNESLASPQAPLHLPPIGGRTPSPVGEGWGEAGEADLAAILRGIAEETSPLFAERGMTLKMEIPDALPLHGDSALLYSLARNLFDNALAYATGATFFRVSATVEGAAYVLTFTDNGQGVPREHLPHLFERFYRIDKGRSRRLGGTGLGLAIVKNIALQYGGTATASLPSGGGFAVTVRLGIR